MDDYSNFVVKADFRTSAPNINSGIYLRRSRDAGDSHMMGYEMQIRNPNPKDKPYDGKSDNHNGYYTGSFSGHLKSHDEPVIEMGKWNTVELTAQGDHFVVVINGTKVLDDHHASFKTGAIGLQRHRRDHRVSRPQDQDALNFMHDQVDCNGPRRMTRARRALAIAIATCLPVRRAASRRSSLPWR